MLSKAGFLQNLLDTINGFTNLEWDAYIAPEQFAQLVLREIGLNKAYIRNEVYTFSPHSADTERYNNYLTLFDKYVEIGADLVLLITSALRATLESSQRSSIHASGTLTYRLFILLLRMDVDLSMASYVICHHRLGNTIFAKE